MAGKAGDRECLAGPQKSADHNLYGFHPVYSHQRIPCELSYGGHFCIENEEPTQKRSSSRIEARGMEELLTTHERYLS
jgi:hypothetical protein